MNSTENGQDGGGSAGDITNRKLLRNPRVTLATTSRRRKEISVSNSVERGGVDRGNPERQPSYKLIKGNFQRKQQKSVTGRYHEPVIAKLSNNDNILSGQFPKRQSAAVKSKMMNDARRMLSTQYSQSSLSS